jgi:hypothetical protein
MGRAEKESVDQVPADELPGQSSPRTTRSISIGCTVSGSSGRDGPTEDPASEILQVDVSGRDASCDSSAKTGVDRQNVVTMADAPARDGTSPVRSRSSAKDHSDPIVVLHESLFSAGISPAAIASTDEATCNAA